MAEPVAALMIAEFICTVTSVGLEIDWRKHALNAHLTAVANPKDARGFCV